MEMGEEMHKCVFWKIFAIVKIINDDVGAGYYSHGKEGKNKFDF